VSVRMHEVFLNKLAKEAVRTGAIEVPDINKSKFGIDFTLDVEVNDVDIDLRPLNAVEVTVDAKFVDFCGPGPFKFIDLDFDMSGTAQAAVADQQLTIIAPEDVSIDYDNTDLAVCAVTSLVDLVTVAFGAEYVFDVVTFVVIGVVIGNVEAATLRERGVFTLGQPIPGTELAPSLEIVQLVVDDDMLHVLGNLTLTTDANHTFIYLRVRAAGITPFRLGPPIANAKVQVIDQDRPQRLGGELGIPKEGTTTKTTGGQHHRFETTTTVELIFPTSNEELATGTTDDDGLARFVIDRRSVGGRVRITKVTEPLDDPNPIPVTRVSEFGFTEVRPDVFFRITLEDGRVFDSRQPRGGSFFAVNVNDRRIGTPQVPLLLVLETNPTDPAPNKS
jgi:hypothetical protein